MRGLSQTHTGIHSPPNSLPCRRPHSTEQSSTRKLCSLGGASGKEPTPQCRGHKRPGFDPWVEKIWRWARPPTPVFLPGESHGQSSLEGCSLWGCAELDVTEVTYLKTEHFFGIPSPMTGWAREECRGSVVVFRDLQPQREELPDHPVLRAVGRCPGLRVRKASRLRPRAPPPGPFAVGPGARGRWGRDSAALLVPGLTQGSPEALRPSLSSGGAEI